MPILKCTIDRRSICLYVQYAVEMIVNMALFNGRLPAIIVLFGLSVRLPIGMMLVGPNYREMKIYQDAHAFQKSGDWQTMLGRE